MLGGTLQEHVLKTGVGPSPGKSARRRRSEPEPRRLAAWLLAPSVAILVLVVVFPLLFALYLSLHQAEPTGGGITLQWKGLANYTQFLFHDDLFWPAVRLTFYFTVVSLLIELALGIGMALVLNQEFRGRNWVRALVLLPWAVPTVVNARMWQWIYAGANYGALNGLMHTLHLLPLQVDKVWLGFNVPFQGVPILGALMGWLGATDALHMIIVADTWKVTPLVTLLVLAGLQTIPGSLYEAAQVDGASAWYRLWHITLPLLRPIILVVLVLRTMELFRVFDIIYIIMQYSIRVVGVYTFEVGMKFLHFGAGSAMSFLIGLMILGLALLYVKMLYSEDSY